MEFVATNDESDGFLFALALAALKRLDLRRKGALLRQKALKFLV